MQPEKLSGADALRHIRMLIGRSKENVRLTRHQTVDDAGRKISRDEIIECLQRGEVIEWPFIDRNGNWQLTVTRERDRLKLTCVCAIIWNEYVRLTTAYR